MNWHHNPKCVSQISYRSVVKTQSVEYVGTWFDSYEDHNLEHLSRFAYKQKVESSVKSLKKLIRSYLNPRIQILQDVANMYDSTTWKYIIDSLNDHQPIADLECTLGVLSPYTNMLNWVSISCARKHNMSTIICL